MRHPQASGPRLSSKLTELRRAAGLTQEELAERSGLSVRGISNLERGVRTRPQRYTLDRLTEALTLDEDARRELEALSRAEHRAGHGPAPGAATMPASTAVPGARESPAGVVPLVGRARECGMLDDFLGGALPGVLLFAGEPGIGKSRLLTEGAVRAAGLGWRVLDGTCRHTAGATPYAAVAEALAGAAGALDPRRLDELLASSPWLLHLLPELATDERPVPPTPAAGQERRLVFASVRRFLAGLRGPAGTLLVLDDLQWASPDTVDLLASLTLGNRDHGTRVLGAFRDTEVAASHPLAGYLADAAREDRLTRHAVAPLSRPEAAELVDAVAEGAVDEARRRSLVDRSGGVPFFLISCAHGPGTEGTEIPWSLSENVQRRVDDLPDSTESLLATVAVARTVVGSTVLSRALGRSQDETIALAEAACDARLLRETPQGYVFAHDLIGEVLDATVTSARRGALQQKLATAFAAEAAAPPDLLADLFHSAGEHARAVEYAEQAGDAAMAQGAWDAAAGHYQRLADVLLALGRPAKGVAATRKLATALSIAGRYRAALAVLDRAETTCQVIGDTEAAIDLVAAIAEVHRRRGEPAAGLRRIQAVTEAASSARPSHALARLHLAEATNLFHSRRDITAAEPAARSADMAQALGDAGLLARAETLRGLVQLNAGKDPEKAVLLLTEAGDFARVIRDHESHVRAVTGRGCAHMRLGDFGRGQQDFELARQLADASGIVMWQGFTEANLGSVAFLQGRWPDAEQHGRRAVAITSSTETSQMLATALQTLGDVCLAQGRLDEAGHHFDQAYARGEQGPDIAALRLASAQLARLDLLRGDPGAALARLPPDLAGRDAERSGAYRALSVHAEALATLGRHEDAARTVREAVADCRATVDLPALVLALLSCARVADLGGRPEAAVAARGEALQLAERMRYPHAVSLALLDEAASLVGRGRRDEAAGPLSRARDILAGLGAELARCTADRQLTDAG